MSDTQRTKGGRFVWWLGDMDRTTLQETGIVKVPGVVIVNAINNMASDLGIDYDDLVIYAEGDFTVIETKAHAGLSES